MEQPCIANSDADDRWRGVGAALSTVGGRRYFASFRIGESVFSVGDTVLLKADEVKMKWCRVHKPPRCAWMLETGGSVAQIREMWECASDDGGSGASEAAPGGSFTWYNFPDECGNHGFPTVFNEVYATGQTMEYDLGTVDGRVHVYDTPEACATAVGHPCDRVSTPLSVVCRRFYSHNTGLCRPLFAIAAASPSPSSASASSASRGPGRASFKAVCDAARCALQLDARPNVLYGRKRELGIVRENIRRAVGSGGGKSAMYISGLPGTGKTVTVQQAVKELLADAPKLFSFVEVNAMALAHPNDAYTELWSRISANGERLPSTHAKKKLKAALEWLPYMNALAKLQRMLAKAKTSKSKSKPKGSGSGSGSGGKRKKGAALNDDVSEEDVVAMAYYRSIRGELPDDVAAWPPSKTTKNGSSASSSDSSASSSDTASVCRKLRSILSTIPALKKRQAVVVVLDEMDSLVGQPRQDVLYNFFDWANTRNSQFVLLAIANTMDLPERELIPKVRSRLGTGADARVVFEPYSREQIVAIVKDRIASCGVFDESAIGMVAAKVRHKGDIRRALQLSRRSIDFCERRVALEKAKISRSRGGGYGKGQGAQQGKRNGKRKRCSESEIKMKVVIPDVNKAYEDLESSNLSTLAVSRASLFEKMLIVALIKQQRSEKAHGGDAAMDDDDDGDDDDGSMEVPFLAVYDTFVRICQSSRSRGGWSRSDGFFEVEGDDEEEEEKEETRGGGSGLLASLYGGALASSSSASASVRSFSGSTTSASASAAAAAAAAAAASSSSSTPWDAGVTRVPLTLSACLPAPRRSADAAKRAPNSIPSVYEMIDVAQSLAAFHILDVVSKVGHHFPCIALIPSVDEIKKALVENWSDLLGAPRM